MVSRVQSAKRETCAKWRNFLGGIIHQRGKYFRISDFFARTITVSTNERSRVVRNIVRPRSLTLSPSFLFQVSDLYRLDEVSRERTRAAASHGRWVFSRFFIRPGPRIMFLICINVAAAVKFSLANRGMKLKYGNQRWKKSFITSLVRCSVNSMRISVIWLRRIESRVPRNVSVFRLRCRCSRWKLETSFGIASMFTVNVTRNTVANSLQLDYRRRQEKDERDRRNDGISQLGFVYASQESSAN